MSLEQNIEKILKIKTTGRDDSNSNLTNYPYEATSYSVLQHLINSNLITKNDVVIDFGCGKGRVDFYLSFYLKCRTIGIEYDQRLYNRAISNLESSKNNRVSFINCCASSYVINDDSTTAYFFNPFSIYILKSVLENIKNSLLKIKREFKLFFYYPSESYISVLDNTEYLIRDIVIDCDNILKDDREYIVVYKFNL